MIRGNEPLRPGPKVAVIGGGIAGLTAAYELLKGGAGVTVFEKELVLGGLASSLPFEGGHLERYYHFICMNDRAYFEMLDELGLRRSLRWRLTKMGQFYNGHLYSFGDPWDLLTFRPLNWRERLRFGLGIMSIKRQPPDSWRKIEEQTVEEWMVARFGSRVFDALHKPLLELKFGVHAQHVSAAWMWARIHRLGRSRTKLLQLERLGYLEGGTQVLIDALAQRIKTLGGTIHAALAVKEIQTISGKVDALICGGERLKYNAVLSTVSVPQLVRMIRAASVEALARLADIASIGVTCLRLRLKKRFSRFFWTNISDRRLAIAGVVEFGNLNPGSCPNGDSIVYLPQYLPPDSSRYLMGDREIFDEYVSYLKLIRSDFAEDWVREWQVFRDPLAQPICTVGFSRQVAGTRTEIEGLYMTDSHQLYPDDRSVSNSIGLGRRAAKLIMTTFRPEGPGQW